jgi:uncharacterized protein (TIRG00374 family)
MKRAATWGGLLVSVVFVWLALRNVDFAQAWRALREASYWPLIPALGALTLANAIRALRWQALFAPDRRPPLVPITHAMLIGLLFNSILPARAGEAARVVALWREARVSRVESLATAVAERVYDVLVLLILLFVAAPFLPSVSWLGKAAVLAAVLVAGMAVGIFVLLRWRERPLVFVLRRVGTQQEAERRAGDLLLGLASFRHPGIALRAFTLTLVSWLVFATSSWLLLLGFDFGVGFGAGLLATIATTLILVIPAAPGGVGQFETAAIVALSAYGVDRSHALSYGIVLHALNLVPYLLAGYIALQRHARIVRRRRAQEGEGQAPNED